MEKKRTTSQNNSLHLYCKLISDCLNENGLTVQMILKPGIELDWTPGMVKEILWRKVQKALFNKQSTTQLSKIGEIDLIVDTINRHLSERFGEFGYEFVPFPSYEQVFNQYENAERNNN